VGFLAAQYFANVLDGGKFFLGVSSMHAMISSRVSVSEIDSFGHCFPAKRVVTSFSMLRSFKSPAILVLAQLDAALTKFLEFVKIWRLVGIIKYSKDPALLMVRIESSGYGIFVIVRNQKIPSKIQQLPQKNIHRTFGD
jgi:hypothetical protein